MSVGSTASDRRTRPMNTIGSMSAICTLETWVRRRVEPERDRRDRLRRKSRNRHTTGADLTRRIRSVRSTSRNDSTLGGATAGGGSVARRGGHRQFAFSIVSDTSRSR